MVADSIRLDDRHSHIGIRLQCRVDDRWERLEAQGWNAAGFNFHHVLGLDGPELEFKRGLTRFTGRIIWRTVSTSDAAMAEAWLNELIYKQAERSIDSAPLRLRLLKLMRTAGLLGQKRAVLASLGMVVSDAAIDEQLQRRRQEQPLYHYGIHVQAPQWADVVANALQVSSVLTSLGKWSDALGPR
jgi:hypothetical protein